MDNWEHLSSKTKGGSFLGVLDFERKIIKKSNDFVYITLESKYRNSGILSLIGAFIFWFSTWRAYSYSKPLGNFFLVFVSILFSLMSILFLSYKRRLFWENGKNRFNFLWGFYPFVKTESLDSDGLDVTADRCQNPKREQIYIANSSGSKIAILKSKSHRVITSVLDEISSFLIQSKH